MAPKISLLLGVFFLILVMLPNTILSKSIGFRFIRKLEGSHKGQTVHGLNELKGYLKKFGNLNYDDHPSNKGQNHAYDDVFDDILESSIKKYQLNYRLKVTGRLDSSTVNQMMKTRCGAADPIKGTKHQHDEESFPTRPTKTHLTYRFQSSVQVPATENIRSISAQAFQRWAEVTHFSFEEVPDHSVADIEIGFHNGSHGDSEAFDGPEGIVAHAITSSGGTSWFLHYDADENWSTNPSPNEVDLESVAMHEIGHLLGLDNSFIPDSVMFPYFDPGVTKRNLNDDDVHAIRALYGLD